MSISDAAESTSNFADCISKLLAIKISKPSSRVNGLEALASVTKIIN